jgi:hypothetical protein
VCFATSSMMRFQGCTTPLRWFTTNPAVTIGAAEDEIEHAGAQLAVHVANLLHDRLRTACQMLPILEPVREARAAILHGTALLMLAVAAVVTRSSNRVVNHRVCPTETGSTIRGDTLELVKSLLVSLRDVTSRTAGVQSRHGGWSATLRRSAHAIPTG